MKKKKMTKSIRTKIELVIRRFDFSKVKGAMLALEWTWGGDNGRYPDKDEMMSIAEELLESSYSSGYSATGGFEARYSGREFYLNFVVEGTDSYVEEEAEEKPEKPEKVLVNKTVNAINSLDV